MTDKEKKVLFEALNEILTNQSRIMKHNSTVNSSDDLYYTNQLINETGRIAYSIDVD
jgi:hypothetical protein